MIKPSSIKLESASVCQLKCPSCPTATGHVHRVTGKGWLHASDLQRLIDASPWLKHIELSNYGEMFLNPQLKDILRIAHDAGVRLTAVNGVNLNHAREDVLEALVRYRFHSMTVSIDGATQGTYQLYRRRGNLERVLENIHTINHFKQKHRSRYPKLTWQFILFEHNVDELAQARKLADDYGMDFKPKLSWDGALAPEGHKDLLRAECGAASREEYRQRYGADYSQEICHQLWNKPQINWDGKVLGCSRNFWGDFGSNVFRDGLLESVNNEKMRYARQMLLGKVPARQGIPCTDCDIYQSLSKNRDWLKRGNHSLSILRKWLSHTVLSEPLKRRLLRNTVINHWCKKYL